jgi:hypothetical protein
MRQISEFRKEKAAAENSRPYNTPFRVMSAYSSRQNPSKGDRDEIAQKCDCKPVMPDYPPTQPSSPKKGSRCATALAFAAGSALACRLKPRPAGPSFFQELKTNG